MASVISSSPRGEGLIDEEGLHQDERPQCGGVHGA